MCKRLWYLLFFLLGCSTPAVRQPASDQEPLKYTLENTRKFLLHERKEDRFWVGHFTNDISEDALVLALAKKNGKLTPELQEQSLETILEHMGASGTGWSAYPGGPVDHNISGIALHCLDLVGVGKGDPRLERAWQAFLERGGTKKLSFYAKVILASLGLIPKKAIPKISPKFFGAPKFIPLHVEKLGVLNGIFVPLVMWRYFSDLPANALAHMRADDWSARGPHRLGQKAPSGAGMEYWIEQGILWTLESRTPGHAWYGTIFSMLAIETLREAERVGMGEFSATMNEAWQTVLHWRWRNWEGYTAQQMMLTSVWDTSSTLIAFRQLEGTPFELDLAETEKSARWLLEHAKSDSERMSWTTDHTDRSFTDVDTTTNVVHSLSPLGHVPEIKNAMRRGLEWVLDKQNKNGGFPVWQKGFPAILAPLTSIFLGGDPIFDDVSQADITSRVTFMLRVVEPLKLIDEDRLMKAHVRACEFLGARMQPVRGLPVTLQSGHWMVNYTYSAANILAGLARGDCPNEKRQLELAYWLTQVQNADGGWGEAHDSYKRKTYVPARSTLSQTAVVLAGLINFLERRMRTPGYELPRWLVPAIDRGVRFLMEQTNLGRSFFEREFTGVMMKGQIYARYELAPAYASFYVFARWWRIREEHHKLFQ